MRECVRMQGFPARAGQAALAWALVAGLVAALLAAALLFWGVERKLPERRSVDLATPTADTSALAAAIERLDQRLARIETQLAQRDERGAREAVPPAGVPEAAPAPLPPGPQGLEEMHRDLLQMSKRIDLLANSLKETYKPAFSLPTLAEVHAARREVDWAFLSQLRQLCLDDRDAARARVRGMSFGEVLQKIGLPNSIANDDGRWTYARTQMGEDGQPRQTGVQFAFVGDTVSSVGAWP